MRLYFPQSIEIDSISNETIPKIETDLGITEIKEKRQTKIEKCNSEETQTGFPEICHISSFVNIEEILPKVLRVETDLSALKSHVKCELADMIRKMESPINGASNGFLCKSCENMKEDLSFLQKERLAKDVFIKSLLETQTATLKSLSNSNLKPGYLSSSHNCSIQNEEKGMENNADKSKFKTKQSEQKQEKNVSK